MNKSKTSKVKKFQGMSYREVQSLNSKNRTKLQKADQEWLKKNGYKNVGWDKVINLYQKIEELLDKYKFDDWTLEELFLEADRIGNKYLSDQEIEEFDQKFAAEVQQIESEIDKQFPDAEMEFINFADNRKKSSTRRSHKKQYKTMKF